VESIDTGKPDTGSVNRMLLPLSGIDPPPLLKVCATVIRALNNKKHEIERRQKIFFIASQ
jgi:hypothetical protein